MIYSLTFQLGEIILFRKKLPIATTIQTNFLNDPALTYLPEYNAPLPVLLPRIAIESELSKQKVTTINNKLYYIRTAFINHFIDLTKFKSFEDYLQKFSAKSRSTLNRKVKKALKNDYVVKIYQTIADVDEFHNYACAVGKNTYQSKLFNSALPDDIKYKNKIIEEAKTGQFLGLILFKDHKPCAYLYIPIANDCYQYEYLGYLQEHSKFSPGTVLQYFALEYIYSNKLKASYFDFTEGDGPHKSFFASNSKICCNALILPKTLANRFWIYLQVILDNASCRLGRLLDKFKLKSRLKKIIRKV